MKNPRWLNICVGLFVLSGVLSFAWLAMNTTGSQITLFGKKPMVVSSHFSNIGSLKVKAPVVMSGVKVGRVGAIELDEDTFTAVVLLEIEPQFNIPADSVASIQTVGLVGEQYISIAPGVASEKLSDQSHLAKTKPALGLESLIESFGGGGKIDDSAMGGQPIRVTAHFNNIGSLKVNSPVMISGVQVGRVSGISLDPTSFDAVVELSLANQVEIPKDTIASIYTSGLIGGQYISLDPGGSFDNLAEGDRIRMTQPAVVIERLIGQFLTSMGSKESSKSDD